MSWSEIFGHDENVDRFRRAFERDRMASTFLFVGPEGIGKRTFALKLAQTLLCERMQNFSACGECSTCLQVLADTHPDIVRIAKPKEKNVIPVDLLIGDRDHRMREGLCHQISLSPYSGKRKVAIIDDADYLGQEGANCLLKTLEEPPAHSILILLGVSVQRQLPTILSRCQIEHFHPLSEQQVAQLLESKCEQDREQAAALAALSAGSVSQALEHADEELCAFRRQLLGELGSPHWNAIQLAKDVAKFVETAGKEAPKRRRRLRQLVSHTASFYRWLMCSLSGADFNPPLDLKPAVDAAWANWLSDQETAGQCVLRCLETLDHIAASGNIATILETWFDDLYRLSHPLATRP